MTNNWTVEDHEHSIVSACEFSFILKLFNKSLQRTKHILKVLQKKKSASWESQNARAELLKTWEEGFNSEIPLRSYRASSNQNSFLHGKCQVFMVRKRYFRQVCWYLTRKLKHSSFGKQANNFSISVFLQRGQVLLLAAFLGWLASSWFIQLSFQKGDQNWFFLSLTKPGKEYVPLKNKTFNFVTRLRTER